MTGVFKEFKINGGGDKIHWNKDQIAYHRYFYSQEKNKYFIFHTFLARIL